MEWAKLIQSHEYKRDLNIRVGYYDIKIKSNPLGNYEVFADYKCLKSIPEFIRELLQLNKIDFLSLSYNNLTYFPEDLCELLIKNGFKSNEKFYSLTMNPFSQISPDYIFFLNLKFAFKNDDIIELKDFNSINLAPYLQACIDNNLIIKDELMQKIEARLEKKPDNEAITLYNQLLILDRPNELYPEDLLAR